MLELGKGEEESVCRFCGQVCVYNKYTHKFYNSSGGENHGESCPDLKNYYHEKALDDQEEKRQQRFANYNRQGTESDEGRRLVEGMELQEENFYSDEDD